MKSKEVHIALQKDLDALVKWKQIWSMKFPDKCKVLTKTNKTKTIRFHSCHSKVREKERTDFRNYKTNNNKNTFKVL